MPSRLLFGSLLLALVLQPSASLAQEPATGRSVIVGIAGGMTFLTGEDRDFFKDGFNVAGSVRFKVPALKTTLRVEASYSGIPGRNKSTQTVPGGPDTLILGDFSVLAGTVGATYGSGDWREAGPYLLVGVGVFHSRAEAVLYQQAVTGSTTDFGLTGGVGLTFRVSTLSAFAEARVHNILGDGGSARMFPVSVGVVF